MGGTFDPIHNGHLAVAEAVNNAYRPQRLLFIPAGDPPHKPGKPISPALDRFEMVLRSISHYPAFDVSMMEINRSGPSYTVDTITELKNICLPGAEILLVVGADAFLEIRTWFDVKRLLSLCKIVVVVRPGNAGVEEFAEKLQEDFDSRISILQMPLLEISATHIRKKIARGEGVRSLMPQTAEEYAISHGLYSACGTELSDERFEWAKSKLKRNMSARRFLHTLGVAEEAERLAKFYGVDANKARWAGLLHDCAKEFSAAKKKYLCEAWGIELDEILENHTDITHQMLGAEAAYRDYYVRDEEVLGAIRYHTTGHGEMTMLDKIICLADYIEPYREDYEELENMRKYAYKNINKALYIGMKSTNKDLKTRGLAIHPWNKAALKLLKKEME